MQSNFLASAVSDPQLQACSSRDRGVLTLTQQSIGGMPATVRAPAIVVITQHLRVRGCSRALCSGPRVSRSFRRRQDGDKTVTAASRQKKQGKLRGRRGLVSSLLPLPQLRHEESSLPKPRRCRPGQRDPVPSAFPVVARQS